jgi:tRNA nucleotidyltransferase/poly(A) polymerase
MHTQKRVETSGGGLSFFSGDKPANTNKANNKKKFKNYGKPKKNKPVIAVEKIEKPVLRNPDIPSFPVRITLPRDVWRVLEKLSESGAEGYLVGGAIRDYPAEPNDYDIVMDASLNDIARLFPGRGKLVGSAHPVFSMQINNREIQIGSLTSSENTPQFEMVTLHNGCIVRNNRTSDIIQDAMQRDFTCNAVYYDWKNQVMRDPFGGWQHSWKKIISFVADEERKMQADPAIILKVMRLMVKADFEIDCNLKLKMLNHLHLLKDVNAAKMNYEVTRSLLDSKYSDKILALFREYHIFSHLYNFKIEEENLIINSIEKLFSDAACSNDRNVMHLLIWCIVMADRVGITIAPYIQSPYQLFNEYLALIKNVFNSFGFCESNETWAPISRLLLLYHAVKNNIPYYLSGIRFESFEHDLVSILGKHLCTAKNNPDPESSPRETPSSQTLFYHANAHSNTNAEPEKRLSIL